MRELLPLLLLGFLLGLKHATDADHVVAVTAIVSRERSIRGAASIGLAWGLGHTLTVAVLGGAIVALGLVIPPRIGLALELAVAVMLVALGALTLRRPRDGHVHATPSTLARSVGVGVVHGLAGSAAVALLVLGSVHDVRWSAFYLAVFGAGTIAGMMLLTALVAMPVVLAARRVRRFEEVVRWTAGVASVAFGLVLFWRIGFVDGLFAATAHWSPR